MTLARTSLALCSLLLAVAPVSVHAEKVLAKVRVSVPASRSLGFPKGTLWDQAEAHSTNRKAAMRDITAFAEELKLEHLGATRAVVTAHDVRHKLVWGGKDTNSQTMAGDSKQTERHLVTTVDATITIHGE